MRAPSSYLQSFAAGRDHARIGWILDETEPLGLGYGLNPETATKNGAFYIDEAKGKISFSADFVGKILIIKYVSDGLSTDDIKVHKFAEEAIPPRSRNGQSNRHASRAGSDGNDLAYP